MDTQQAKYFSEGVYSGKVVNSVDTGLISVREVDYKPNQADWHYHENAFFCHVLNGAYSEGTLKNSYDCSKGDLFFQRWDEKHHNTSTADHTCLYVELKHDWLKTNTSVASSFNGHLHLEHPAIKVLFQRIRFEGLRGEAHAPLVIEELIMDVFDYLRPPSTNHKQTPSWVFRIQQMLHDVPGENWSLAKLAHEAGVHPNHLCRYFKMHFNCTISSYIRKIKIERAFNLLAGTDHSVTDIGYLTGFSDQSHFIRCFKEVFTVSPTQIKKSMRMAKR